MPSKPAKLSVGLTHEIQVDTDASQTAHALGNPGVHVLATIFLIGFIEECCGLSVYPFLEKGYASVGTRVNIAHRAPAVAGTRLRICSRLIAIRGTHLSFEATVYDGERILMDGTHGRAIMNAAKISQRLEANTPNR